MIVNENLRSLAVLAAFVFVLLSPQFGWSHCDGLDGPVVAAARKALETKDVNPVLIWVQAADEPEVRRVFDHVLQVRAVGAEARSLADRFFLETVVRLHRAGEGAPFTGLKEAGRDLGPAIPAADRALSSGELAPLVRMLTAEADSALTAHFREVKGAINYASSDVEGGRRWVKAYVEYIHFVERLYQAIVTSSAGHAEESAAPHGHSD